MGDKNILLGILISFFFFLIGTSPCIGKETSFTEIHKLKEMQEQFYEQLKKMPSTEGKNIFENHLSPMHPKMKSDLEIEKLIYSSRDQLKRPIPW